MAPKAGYRARLFRAIHAEAAKRGFDHDALHKLCEERYGARSMAEMSEKALLGLYKSWTGKGLRRQGKLPRRGEAAKTNVLEPITGADLDALEAEFARRGWGAQTKLAFIRRQLRGRDLIRTRSDLARVFNGLRAMNRRDGLA